MRKVTDIFAMLKNRVETLNHAWSIKITIMAYSDVKEFV